MHSNEGGKTHQRVFSVIIWYTVEYQTRKATSPGTTLPESKVHNDHKYDTDLFKVVATYIEHGPGQIVGTFMVILDIPTNY